MVLFGTLQKLAELSTKIQRIEIMMSILEAKVGIVEIFIDLPLKEFQSKPLPS